VPNDSLFRRSSTRFTVIQNEMGKRGQGYRRRTVKTGTSLFRRNGKRSSPNDDFKRSASEIEKKDSDAFRLSSIINETAERYIEMNRKYTGKTLPAKSVSEMLEKKIDEVRKKFGDRFTFKVYFEDGKVRDKT
jgi:hypothetical protein